MNPNFSESAIQDLKLVMAARSGDEQAFSQLMGRYMSTIYFMLIKIVPYREVAKELTIEAFSKAFINIHQYEPQFAFSSWLFRIAHNTAIDHLRRRKVSDSYIELPLNDDDYQDFEFNYNVQSTIDNPEEVFIKGENAELLRKMIQSLKPQYRILIEMRYLEEYTVSEISSELNLPVGTIKVQLSRSRKMLFERLKNSKLKWS